MPRGKPLTDKQEKFVLLQIEGMSQIDAYKNSYNATNMTEKTAREKASKLMAQDNIRARYNQLLDKVRKSAEDKAIVTVEDVLQSILKVRSVCMQTLAVTDKQGNTIAESMLDTTGALKANEMLGKTLKMFTDKLEHSGEIKMPTVIIE
ncbi:MAG TPA: terminase small subunit [Fusibacter sp.]|nr:terminase small subunit [Fusibacter sp.]